MASSGNGENPFNSEYGLIIRRNEVRKFMKVLKSSFSKYFTEYLQCSRHFSSHWKTVMDTSLANILGFNSGEIRESEKVFLSRQKIEACRL